MANTKEKDADAGASAVVDVASRVGIGMGNGLSGLHALKWALERVVPAEGSVYLLHVQSPLRWIPNAMGGKFPVEQASRDTVKRFKEGILSEKENLVDNYRRLCDKRKVKYEVCYAENDSVQKGLVDQISELEIAKLVLGSSSQSLLSRALKKESISTYVAKHAPLFCTVLVICKGKLCFIKDATESPSLHWSPCSSVSAARENGIPTVSETSTSSGAINEDELMTSERPQNIDGGIWSAVKDSMCTSPQNRLLQSASMYISQNSPQWMLSDYRSSNAGFGSPALTRNYSVPSESASATPFPHHRPWNIIDSSMAHSINPFGTQEVLASESSIAEESLPADSSFQVHDYASHMIAEHERRRDEAFKEANIAKQQALRDSKRCEEALAALQVVARERETLRQMVAEEVRKHQETQAQLALQKEGQKYTEYTFQALQAGTNYFHEENKLGEGGYGPVFKGKLHHTTVAIKVLAHDGSHGREEFQSEVEVLSRIRHPHMVMLLGACSEKGCIVYEYMANGSLEDRLNCKNGTTPLPWYVRFRICLEVAIALVFLHSRPQPIVHRDLKPGNILLDHHFVSKIGDVGLAKLVPNNLTFSVTMYKESMLVGTFAYIDPDYQRTGVVSCESDVYALGIVMLQLLTGRPAVGVTNLVEEAIDRGNFEGVLDKSAGEWPLAEALALACLSLQCAEPKRKHRPNLEKEVLPQLERIQSVAGLTAASMATAGPSSLDTMLLPHFAEANFGAGNH